MGQKIKKKEIEEEPNDSIFSERFSTTAEQVIENVEELKTANFVVGDIGKKSKGEIQTKGFKHQ